MEWMLDTANLSEAQRGLEHFPISGLTTNPSLLKREAQLDVWAHLKSLRSILNTRSLHVQTISEDVAGIKAEAQAIVQRMDAKVYIKIPSTQLGVVAMRQLKAQGYRITATGIYTRFQALMAIEAGVDYIAPYVNRMANLDLQPFETLAFIAQYIRQNQASTKIVAASFKSLDQVAQAIDAGVHALTLEPSLYDQMFEHPSISRAAAQFKADFEAVHGVGTTLASR